MRVFLERLVFHFMLMAYSDRTFVGQGSGPIKCNCSPLSSHICVVVFRAQQYSPPWLLRNSCQAPSSLAINIATLTRCTVHANGSPQGHHWHKPSNRQWHVCSRLRMCAPPKFCIKGVHATPLCSLFSWLWVGTHCAPPHFL